MRPSTTTGLLLATLLAACAPGTAPHPASPADQLSISGTVTGAVVAEYVGADRGLGYLSEFSTAEFRTARSFAAIALLALIGMAFFGAVGVAERLTLPHRRHSVRPTWRRR